MDAGLIRGTVLIADDEALARQALKAMIERNLPGLEIAAEAVTGREAVELYEQHRPDLVIMDIRMPGMNGTEAASAILNRDPDAAVLMLTAYDTFGFIQEAMNAGARGYLLKPLNRDQFLSTVETILHRRPAGKNRGLNENLSRYLEQEIVNALAAHQPDYDRIAHLSELSGLSLSGGFFVLAAGEFPCSEALDRLREGLGKVRHFCTDSFGFPVVLFPGETPGDTEGIEDRLGRRVLEVLSRHYPSMVRVVPGISGQGLEGMRRSFESALALLVRESSTGFCSCRTEVSPTADSCGDSLKELTERFTESLKINRVGAARGILSEMTVLLRGVPGEFDSLREQVNEILVLLKRYARFRGLAEPRDRELPVYRRMIRIRNQKELADLLDESIRLLIGDAEPSDNRDTHRLINAFVYLQEHLYEEISLDQMADHSGLTPQYISRKIKEKFGRTFLEYVTEKRLDYARYLLISTSDPVKEVGRKVGYADANYFSRIFRKHLNMTPLQYRQDAGEISD